MPAPPEDALAPFDELALACVPKAGRAELEEYRQRRGATATDFGIWTFASLCALGLLVLVSTIGPGGFVPFGGLLAYFLWKAGRSGAKLLFGERSWHALPDGADERTARLEDTTVKALRAWNADVRRWNAELASWRTDVREWRAWQMDPGTRPIDWSETFAEERRGDLEARLEGLYHDRRALRARITSIRRDIAALSASRQALKGPDAPRLLVSSDDPDQE